MRQRKKAQEKTAELDFDFESHIYKVDGLEYPSVTQLLNEFKLLDYSMVPPNRLEHKRILGVAVHLACQYLDEQCLDEESLSEEIKPYVNAYRKFREIEEFEPRHTEVKMFSRKWKFAGTPDRQGIRVLKLGDFESIVDLKCTFYMYPACGAQLAGYQMLIEENLGIKIKKRYGLQLKPTGNYELIEYADKSDFTDFQGCIYLHWQKRNKYKTIKGGHHAEYDINE